MYIIRIHVYDIHVYDIYIYVIYIYIYIYIYIQKFPKVCSLPSGPYETTIVLTFENVLPAHHLRCTRAGHRMGHFGDG